MDINFFNETKKYTDMSDLNFLYMGEFNKGNLYQTNNQNDFIDIFGDYTSQSYLAVKQILQQGITLNIGRVFNPINSIPTTYNPNDETTRTAHRFVLLEDTITTRYTQRIISDKVSPLDKTYIQLKAPNLTLVEQKDITQPETSGYIFYSNTEGIIDFVSTEKLDNEDEIRMIKFKYDSGILLNGIIGLDETGFLKFKITTDGKIYGIDNSESLIYDVGFNPFNLGAELFSQTISADIILEIEIDNLIVGNDNYEILFVDTTTDLALFSQPFYSNEKDYYLYDYTDISFQSRVYDSLYNINLQPKIGFFAKTPGLWGNNIMVELIGNKFLSDNDKTLNGITELNSDEILLNIYYESNLVESFVTSSFDVESNYVKMVYADNNNNVLLEDVILKFSLIDGNDGVITTDSVIKSFTQNKNKYNVVLLNSFYGLDNISIYNSVADNFSDSIILCNTEGDIDYFYNHIKHKSNIFAFDGKFLIEGFEIPKFLFLLNPLNLILGGTYYRMINIPTASNYLSVSTNNDTKKYNQYGINYFQNNQLKTEVSLNGGNSLGKTVITKTIKSNLQKLLNDFIFNVKSNLGDIEKVMTNYIKTLNNITVSFVLLSQSETQVTYKVTLTFPNDIDAIIFNVIKQI